MSKPVSSSMTLNVGIIGLGVGEAHIAGYEKHPGCKVGALCDFDRQKIETAREKYKDRKITDEADDILTAPDIQVVSIASYDSYHHAQTVKAVESGKHVFVEKPLCLSAQEAKDIRAALNRKPQLKLSSNLILRLCPRFQALKEKIDAGLFGDVFHIEGDYQYGRLHKVTEGWRGKIDFYSVVYGGGVHIIDLFLWLTGRRVTEVAAFGSNFTGRGTQFKFDDSVTAVMKFDNGMTGKMSVHFGCAKPHYHSLNVFGTKATFENTLDYGLFYNSTDPASKPEKMEQAYPGVHKGGLIYDFVQSIIENRESLVSRDEVFDAMSICFAIEEAKSTGKPVKVQYI